MPAIFSNRPFVAAGGLISYGGDATETYRLVGTYTGKILKGANPGDLPVQRATKVELIINLKTAKALGIALPLALSGRADEVIELEMPFAACMSLFMALNGHGCAATACPLLRGERTCRAPRRRASIRVISPIAGAYCSRGSRLPQDIKSCRP